MSYIEQSLAAIPLQYIILLAIWTIPWKGLALWKSARRKDKLWFIILLIVNTLGILEILYLFFFSKSRRVDTQIQV